MTQVRLSIVLITQTTRILLCPVCIQRPGRGAATCEKGLLFGLLVSMFLRLPLIPGPNLHTGLILHLVTSLIKRVRIPFFNADHFQQAS